MLKRDILIATWKLINPLTIAVIISLLGIKGMNQTISTFLIYFLCIWVLAFPIVFYLSTKVIEECFVLCPYCNRLYKTRKNLIGNTFVICPVCRGKVLLNESCTIDTYGKTNQSKISLRQKSYQNNEAVHGSL
jgi:hypothetical protein